MSAAFFDATHPEGALANRAAPAGRQMECRAGCGACCIAPSISSAIPGMPAGKPAGIRCVQLTGDYRCAIFGSPLRPACCSGLQPGFEMCGADREQAMVWLAQLDRDTRP